MKQNMQLRASKSPADMAWSQVKKKKNMVAVRWAQTKKRPNILQEMCDTGAELVASGDFSFFSQLQVALLQNGPVVPGGNSL